MRVRHAIVGLLALTMLWGMLGASPLFAQSIQNGSFSRYLLFTDHHTMPDGSPIWFTSSAHFDGWVHTNGEFRFSGAPVFGDFVTSVNPLAWFYNNGSNVQVDSDHFRTFDVPLFAKGFVRGVDPILMPTDSYAQQQAALGLDAVALPPPSRLVRTVLGLNGSGTVPSGVYVPTSGGSVAGGIYVEGDVDRLVATADTVEHRQEFRITQGTVTTNIVVDRGLNLTTMTRVSGTTVYPGTPHGLVYVNGIISDLRGPDRAGEWIPAALLEGEQWLVVSPGDIVIQGDLAVQLGELGSAMLGVFSSNGSLRVGELAPNNLHIDAFLMASGSTGAFQVDRYSSSPARGAVYLWGGCATRYYGAFGQFGTNGAITHGYARNFRHDDREVVPPYYPTVAPMVLAVPRAPDSPAALRLAPSPNPARGSLRLRYAIARDSHVQLQLFDIAGRRIAMLVNADQPAGEHDVDWSSHRLLGRPMEPGVYLVRLDAAGSHTQSKVIFLR